MIFCTTLNATYNVSNCLEKKQLNKVRDVLYDKENGVIKSIPQLQFTNSTRKFHLKRCDKQTYRFATEYGWIMCWIYIKWQIVRYIDA